MISAANITTGTEGTVRTLSSARSTSDEGGGSSGEGGGSSGSDTASFIASVVAILAKILPFLKGSTQHMDWDTANSIAKKLATQLDQKVRSTVTQAQYDEITQKCLTYMLDRMAIRWYDVGPEPSSKIIPWLRAFPLRTDWAGIYTIINVWGIWSLRNCDLDSSDQWNLVAHSDLPATLGRAYQEVTGKVLDFGSVDETKSTFPPNPPNLPPSEGGGTTSLASIGSNIWVILLLVGVGFFFLTKGKQS